MANFQKNLIRPPKETEKGKGQEGRKLEFETSYTVVQTCAISSYLFAFMGTSIFRLLQCLERIVSPSKVKERFKPKQNLGLK